MNPQQCSSSGGGMKERGKATGKREGLNRDQDASGGK